MKDITNAREDLFNEFIADDEGLIAVRKSFDRIVVQAAPDMRWRFLVVRGGDVAFSAELSDEAAKHLASFLAAPWPSQPGRR